MDRRDFVPRPWLQWAIALILILGLLAALDLAARRVADIWVTRQLQLGANAAASFRAAMVRSEIEKQRTIPIVLAEDPDVRSALATADPDRVAVLNAKLAALADGTRASVIYLMDRNGLTVAASNYRLPASFVGSDYSFRPYFSRAMTEGTAEHFALGTVSHEPGLYITRRLDGPDGPIGVLVVKVVFGALEADWRAAGQPTFVTSPRGIVLVTSEPDWRFDAAAVVPPAEKEAIRASLQFGAAPLAPLPVRSTDEPGLVTVAARADQRSFQAVEGQAPVASTDWTMHVLTPLTRPLAVATSAARLIAFLTGLLAIGLAAILYLRRRRTRTERGRAEAMRIELADRVRERTAALSAANDRLRVEIEDRQRAEARLTAAQDELIQASKLAVLGQIAASVAHEVNQPVAAIQTFAETGATLLARGHSDTARDNFKTIAALTERIGAITGALRSFARKSDRAVGPVPLRAAIDGALLLVGHRLRQNAIALEMDLPAGEIIVAAEKGRLEQVLVNLIQNAIEALASPAADGSDDGRMIRIAVETDDHTVRLIVTDNGPGLAPEIRARLFMPFTTSKPEGLGLGLVISHDLAATFGGSLTAENRDGAVFTLTLRRLS